MRSTPVRLALVAVAFLAVAGSACGGSGYQYVKNDDLGIYARLPDDWTVFDEDDLFPDATERELERQAQSLWVRVFDASDDPSIDAAAELRRPDAGRRRRRPRPHDRAAGVRSTWPCSAVSATRPGTR